MVDQYRRNKAGKEIIKDSYYMKFKSFIQCLYTTFKADNYLEPCFALVLKTLILKHEHAVWKCAI